MVLQESFQTLTILRPGLYPHIEQLPGHDYKWCPLPLDWYAATATRAQDI